MNEKLEKLTNICLYRDLDAQLVLASLSPSLSSLEQNHGETKISFYDFSLSHSKDFILKNLYVGKDLVLEKIQLFKETLNKKTKNFQWKEPNKEIFETYFDQVKQAIAQGSTQKAVPVCFSTSKGELSDFERTEILENLIKNESFGYPVAVISESFEYYGLSPELLFEKQGKHLRTMALAGTRPLDETFSEQEFLADPKERQEHQFVVDSLVEQLSPMGELELGPTKVLRLNKMAHLKTDIQIRLTQVLSEEVLIEGMHPTPALGDFPKGSMKDWFQKMDEDLGRGIFGAPILIQKEQSSRCIVGIRSLYREKEIWKLGSGCGVVEQSEIQKEWQELATKRESVKTYLGLK